MLNWIMIYYAIQPSIFQSPMVRRSGSKLMPTFTIGSPERANFEELHCPENIEWKKSLSVIDMHDAGRSQARHLDCIFQRNASFQHDGAECTFDRRFSFACISDDVILEHHSPVVNPPLWSQHFAIDDLSSPPFYCWIFMQRQGWKSIGSQLEGNSNITRRIAQTISCVYLLSIQCLCNWWSCLTQLLHINLWNDVALPFLYFNIVN